jgi:hypothetical protein
MDFFMNLFRKKRLKSVKSPTSSLKREISFLRASSCFINNTHPIYLNRNNRFLTHVDDSNEVFLYGDIFKAENEYFQQEREAFKKCIEGKVKYAESSQHNEKGRQSGQRSVSCSAIEDSKNSEDNFDLSRSKSINIPLQTQITIENTLISKFKQRHLNPKINPITGEEIVYKHQTFDDLSLAKNEYKKRSSPIPILRPFRSNIDNNSIMTPYNSPQTQLKNILQIKQYIDNEQNINRDISEAELIDIHALLAKNALSKIYFVPILPGDCSKPIEGRYNYAACLNFHILYRYKILDNLGKGCYGKVLKCYDYKHNIDCALKVIKSHSNYYKSYLKEVDILVHLNQSYNKAIAEGNLFRLLYSEPLKCFTWQGHGVIAMRLYSKNLYKSNLGKIGRPALKIILTDIIEALSFLKYANVLHLDLKPENIFFIKDSSFNVVIGDFGLSKICDTTINNEFYVQTCWYRSPEVIFRIPYSFEADLWSVGTIMIELMINKPIFQCKLEEELYFALVMYLGRKPISLQVNNHLMLDNLIDVTPQKKVNIKAHIGLIKQLIKENEFSEIRLLLDGILKWDPKERISLSRCKEILNTF